MIKEINFEAVAAIETQCVNLTQTASAFWLVIESLESEFGGNDGNETAALNFWTRRGLYLDALYLIFRDLTESNESISAELESNLITKKEPAVSA